MNSNGSIGLSLFLVAVGAVLAWAVNGTVTRLDVRMVIVIGVVGLLLSLLFWGDFRPARDSRLTRASRRALVF